LILRRKEGEEGVAFWWIEAKGASSYPSQCDLYGLFVTRYHQTIMLGNSAPKNFSLVGVLPQTFALMIVLTRSYISETVHEPS